jgi:hypothetical protein
MKRTNIGLSFNMHFNAKRVSALIPSQLQTVYEYEFCHLVYLVSNLITK